MAGSALIGQPPNNEDDWFIIRGLARRRNIPDAKFDPSKGYPWPVKRPPNPEYTSRGPGMLASMSVAIFLVVLITGSRIGLRIFRRDLKVGIDDYVVVPAALLTIAFLATAMSEVTHGGAGNHIYDLTYQELNYFLKAALLNIPLFFMTVGMIKIAIIFFNRRLTGLTSHRWTIVHYVFLATTIAFMITALFSELYQCGSPVKLKFNLLENGRYPTNAASNNPTNIGTNIGKCIDGNKLGYALATIHSFLDFCLLTIPIIVLCQMKLSLSRKLRLGFLFAVGLVSCIGSVMRQVRQAKMIHNPDVSWVYADLLDWTIIDLFFGITAASLPVLNAALPKRWRDSGNRTPQLSHFSIFNSGNGTAQSARQYDMSDIVCRPDGTAPTDVEKDSFHKKTEQRWDDAYAGVQEPDRALTPNTSVGTKRSDDTLV